MDATNEFTGTNARIRELEHQLAEAHRSLEFTRAWFLSRMQRLKDFANTLPEPQRQQYFDIVSEGGPPPA